MLTLEELVLSETALRDQETKNAKPRNAKKRNAEYRVLSVSGPDFVVEKKTPRTHMVLACIVSMGQMYIRDEGTGEVARLDQDNFRVFMSDASECISLMSEDGVTPFWIDALPKQSAERSDFIDVINSSICRPYLINGFVTFESIYPYGAGLLDRYHSPASFMRDLDFKDVKKVLEILKQYLPKERIVQMIDRSSALYSFLCKARTEGGQMSSYDIIRKKWGIDGVREILRQFAMTPVNRLPSAAQLLRILKRTNRGYTPFKKCREETEFDLRRFAEYMFCACVAQGCAEQPEMFWSTWADYLDFQATLEDKIINKYSEHLLSDETVAAYKFREWKQASEDARFANIAQDMAQYEYKKGQYCIVAARSTLDLIDEHQRMGHCIHTYGSNIVSGRCYIFFLRQGNREGKSLATIEVHMPSFTLGQVHAKFNRTPEKKYLDAVNEWFAWAKAKHAELEAGTSGNVSVVA